MSIETSLAERNIKIFDINLKYTRNYGHLYAHLCHSVTKSLCISSVKYLHHIDNLDNVVNLQQRAAENLHQSLPNAVYDMYQPKASAIIKIWARTIHAVESLGFQRSSRRILFGSDIMSIIIFSGESSQLPKVFRSTCRWKECKLLV